jgi:hypothetical protein
VPESAFEFFMGKRYDTSGVGNLLGLCFIPRELIAVPCVFRHVRFDWQGEFTKCS